MHSRWTGGSAWRRLVCWGSIAAAAAGTTACSEEPREVGAGGAADATRIVTDTIEGLLRVEPDGTTLEPCDGGGPAWVVEDPGADLRSAASGFGLRGGTPLLVRVVGEYVTPPETGPGAGGESAIRVVRWVYLAEDTSACAPERGDGVEDGGAEDRPPGGEQLRPRVDGNGPGG